MCSEWISSRALACKFRSVRTIPVGLEPLTSSTYLVNEASWEVENVARLQDGVDDWLADLLLAEVGAREARQNFLFAQRLVDSPAFLAFQLEHEGLDVVVVRREALRSGRSEIAGADEKPSLRAASLPSLLFD